MTLRIDVKRPVEYSGYKVSRYHYEGSCSHDDDKPTENVAGGSTIIETDTGIVNLYDEASEAWVPQFSIKKAIE